MAMPLWLGEKLWMAGRHRRRARGLRGRRCSSASTTNRTPPRRSIRRRSSRPPSSPWTASANGRPRRSASGRGNDLEIIRELRFPHSLGLLYSAFTYFAGFKVNSGEYKVMGLAPYGEPQVRQADQGPPRRDRGRRQPVDEPGVLHLRARPDDDRLEARAAVRRAGAQARSRC